MPATPEEVNKILGWLGAGAEAGAEGNFGELCRAVTVRKNKEHALRFAAVPPAERVVFLPQCLRRIGRCQAIETARGYECRECMQCPAGTITREAARLGYKGVYMLKGGRAVAQVLCEARPTAVVGVACSYEGALGILECERKGVAVQFVPLTRDGCAETDVDLDEVLSVLEFVPLARATGGGGAAEKTPGRD